MRKPHAIILGVAGLLLLVGAVVVATLVWLLLGGSPASKAKAAAIPPDSLSMANQKLESCFVNAKQDELVSLALTVDEVNALLNYSLGQPGVMESFKVDNGAGMDFSVVLRDGLFQVRASGKKGGDVSLFGAGLNLFVTAAPEIKDGALDIGVQSIKVGNLPLPAGMLNKRGVFRSSDLKGKGRDGMVSVLDAVREFKVDKQGVTLKFYPLLLDKVLGKSLPK